jgi:co-chaperonin GroES (HSP10)
MTTKITPLWDRVLLEPLHVEESTQNLWIYLPESDKKEIPFLYKVIEIWTGTAEKPMIVKVWDTVLSWQYSWDQITFNNIQYKIVGIDFILAIITD